MKNALKCKKTGHCSAAHVVDGKLILSFPEALTPIVWQMDLAQTKASALEVRESPLKESYTLFLKTPKGEALEVASFAKKNQAVDGLMAASQALKNAQGQIRPFSVVTGQETFMETTPAPAKKGFSWKTFILGSLLVFILFVLWTSFTPPGPAGTPQASLSSDTAPAPAAEDNGVPVSADEFLRKR